MRSNHYKLTMLFFSLLILVACQKEDELPTAILGSWISDAYPTDEPTTNSQLYIFNGDGTFRALTRIVKTDDQNEVVGFTYRAEGTFNFIKNQLRLSYDEIYTSSTGLISTNIEGLDLQQDAHSQELEIAFRNQNTRMEFIFPVCPPNANCLGSLFFNKLASFE